MRKYLITLILLCSFVTGSYAQAADTSVLSDEQKNSLALLNYIMEITSEIEVAADDPIQLDHIYDTIFNNTNPMVTDTELIGRIDRLCEMIGTFKRNYYSHHDLRYRYEQTKSKAMKTLIIESAVVIGKSFSDPTELLELIPLATSTWSNNFSEDSELRMDYLSEESRLDEIELETVAAHNRDAWEYTAEFVRENQIEDAAELTLSNKKLAEFSMIISSPDSAGRLYKLLIRMDDFYGYDKYWLELAQAYFETGKYELCLEAYERYKDLGIHIFRKNYSLAEKMPAMILSVQILYQKGKLSRSEYESRTVEYIRILEKNCDKMGQDWALQYCCARAYLDLYQNTGKDEYLEEAYLITLANISYLAEDQEFLNQTYLNKVETKTTTSEMTKEEKNEIHHYNDTLEEIRKTELPPVYEPLVLNLQLMNGLLELEPLQDKADEAKQVIHHATDRQLFLVDSLNWFFDSTETDGTMLESASIDLRRGELRIPVRYLSDAAEIKVYVHSLEPVVYENWTITAVDRENEGDISTYIAEFECTEMKSAVIEDGTKIDVQIIPRYSGEFGGYRFSFTKVTEKKWLSKKDKYILRNGEFRPVIAGDFEDRPIMDGTYLIRPVVPSILHTARVSVEGAGSEDRTNVKIKDNLFSPSKEDWFVISHVSGDYYKIVSGYCDKALDVSGGYPTSGTNVQIYRQNGTDAQMWRFIPAGDGSYYIQSKLGTYLDVENAQKKTSGSYITWYELDACNVWAYKGMHSDTQKWYLATE